MIARVDAADPWFCDLEAVAKRVAANERRARQNRKRITITALFLLLAFLLLAWRSERSDGRIDRNADRIRVEQDRLEQTRRESCLRGVIIIGKYNRLQDQLAAIERTAPAGDLRDARIAALERARILPLPACEGTPSP